MASPPPDSKRPEGRTARAEHHLRQPNWPGIPPKGLSGTEATCPGSVSHQEGLRLFEEGSREEPGRILGRIVRDHGGSFPSTNLNRASRKKRPDLLRTPKGTGSGHRLTANKWLHQRSQLGRTLVSSQTHFACTHSDELCEVTEVQGCRAAFYTPH